MRNPQTFVAMANISLLSCFLLVFLSLVCGSEVPSTNAEEFPTSSEGFLAGTNNRSHFDMKEMNDVDSGRNSEMSPMMELHLLRMLKLSSRPPASVAESVVPGYIRALQHAVDSVPPSTVTFSGDDHLTWAVKATQGE